MRSFEVTIPITGVVYFTVDCESDDEDTIYDACMSQWDEMSSRDKDSSVEWEFTPHVTQGYAHTNDIYIEEV